MFNLEAMAAALAVMVVYFLPWAVAYFRGHPSALGILALDLLLGWTVIGWVAALIWSLSRRGSDAPVDFSAGTRADRHCPECVEKTLRDARVCRFCGAKIEPA